MCTTEGADVVAFGVSRAIWQADSVAADPTAAEIAAEAAVFALPVPVTDEEKIGEAPSAETMSETAPPVEKKH